MSARILALETSTLSCSVALFDGDACVHAEQRCEEQHVHASNLLPMIDAALKAAGWQASDLSAVAACAGPGSYTGLRIGTSTAKGICHAQGIPLIAINSLEIQACTCCSSHRCSACKQASPSKSATEHDRVEVSRAKIRALIGPLPLLQWL